MIKVEASRKNSVTLNEQGIAYQICLPHVQTDYIQKKIAEERRPYEVAMLEDMCTRLSAKDQVIDVGANVGNHTLYLAALAGCKVVAFEPNVELCEAINVSKQLNGLDERIDVRQVGVGDSCGRGCFKHLEESNLGAQSIEVSSSPNAPLEIVTIDSLNWEEPVCAIKIDVEGMELSVLRGASKLIERDHPALYVECQTESGFVEIYRWLKVLGYCYWDTFNATPTHLFIHSFEISTEKIQLQGLYKAARDNYQTDLQINSLRKARDSATEKYRDASESINKLKRKLDDANQKYRRSSERINNLKELLEIERVQRRQSEQELNGSREQQKVLEAELQHAVEKEIELAEISNKLDAANEKYRHSSERVTELKDALESERLRCQQAEQILNSSREKLLGFERLSMERKSLLIAAEHAKEQLENEYRALETELLQARASELKVAELTHKLEAANTKYRHITGSEIPKLNERLVSQTRQSRNLQEQLDARAQELNLAKEKQVAAEKRILALRASFTYKAGYLLRSQSGSFIGLLKLPIGLWRLYRQSRLRKKSRQMQGAEIKRNSSKPEALRKIHIKTPGPVLLSTTDLSAVLIPPDYVAREMKVACIMDDFTFASYQPECCLQQLTPNHWRSELENFVPELLFIESAWRGKDELWGSKVGHRSEEIIGIVKWCKEHSVPTVFWNKEDPIHFETFLNTAKMFDHVFTTDMDCIHRYKAALGHERVYFLPFASQPAIHNPIEKYHRKDAFCFAGAYYVRYPNRIRDLESFVEDLPAFRSLEIYDRNYGKDDPNYQFPENYHPYIVGTLPFAEIDKAYKGYNYAINLNSIKQSQTMFARRVYELLASNTLTISNYSRGVRLLFGDLVVTSDSGAEIVNRLQTQQETASYSMRLRLAALRKTMQEHTYGERLEYLRSKVFGGELGNGLPTFTVVSAVKSLAELEVVLLCAEEQQSVDLTLIVFVDGKLVVSDVTSRLANSKLIKHCVMDFSQVNGESLAELFDAGDWITAFSPDDYYGPNFLLDMALATRYSQAVVIGKGASHVWDGNNAILCDGDAAYRPAPALFYRSSAISRGAAKAIDAKKWLMRLSKGQYQLSSQLAIDPFNYCRDGAFIDTKDDNEKERLIRAAVDDLPLNTGLEITTLANQAETIEPAEATKTESASIEASELANMIGAAGGRMISVKLTDEGFCIASSLSDGKHQYLYAESDLDREHLMKDQESENTLPVYLDMQPGLNVSLVLLFLDANRQRISHQILLPNRNHSVELPIETRYVRMGLRVYASGEATIKRLVFAHKDLEPAKVLGHSDVLMLTNHYPSYDDLYRNGFVHSRVKAYRECGCYVDVFRLRKGVPISWHEFQDIDVTTGSQEVLRRMLASGQYRHVLVHFLDADMWEVLSEYIDRVKVTVWLHGADVQPWWRRAFNYETDEQLALAKIQSENRLGFWKSLLSPMPQNLKLVFVSQYLADIVMEDLKVEIPQSQFEIIHNPIDTELFSYVPKSPEQRKKILSIRPYASRVYANDLSVQVILELSSKPFFNELEFKLIGDGKLFDETVEPLRGFENVSIEKRFLDRAEIAKLHKEYGVFLCPSRMDTQGVSRDEAMASGLVPVTNDVAAIPEFVDKNCGFLAPIDDAQVMADGVVDLHGNPEKFLTMSTAAMENVARNRSVKEIIVNEMQLFQNTPERQTKQEAEQELDLSAAKRQVEI